MKLWKYMELNSIIHLPLAGRELLGKWIYFTEKRDGTCLAIWLKPKSDWQKFKLKLQNFIKVKKNVQFHFYEMVTSTKGQEYAEKDIRTDFFNCEDFKAVETYLAENLTHYIYGELLRIGKDEAGRPIPALSPTRIELHEKVEFIVFDIYDGTHFMGYQQVHQTCYHYSLKCVRLFGEGRFTSLESLFAYRDEILKLCKQENREGVVLKTFTSDQQPLYCKEKLDTATPRHPTKIDKGAVTLPPLPDSEAFGAVDKAYADLGQEKFLDKKTAMPLIAQYINEEMHKHLCSAPALNFFRYYTKYLEENLGVKIPIPEKRAITQKIGWRAYVSIFQRAWAKIRKLFIIQRS